MSTRFRFLLLGVGAGCCCVVAAGQGAGAAHAAGSVYVTNGYPSSTDGGPATVSQFDVDAGGRLSPKSPATVPAGQGAFGIAVNPGARSVYVANFFDVDPAFGAAMTVSQFDVGAEGRLSAKAPAKVSALQNPAGVAVSPDARSVYVTNSNTTLGVSQFDVGAGGALRSKAPPSVAAMAHPRGIVVSPDGRSAYVTGQSSTDPGPDTVRQYDIGAGGRLTPKSPPAVATGTASEELAISPDGRSVYVTNSRSFSLSQFDVGVDGALTPKSPPTVAAGKYPEGVVVGRDGLSVYVADRDSNAVSQFDVGAGGTLTPKADAFVATRTGPRGVAVSLDGLSVYVTNHDDGTVSQFDVGAGGALTAKVPATVPAGANPTRVAVSPDLGPPPTPGPGPGPGAGAPALTALSMTDRIFAVAPAASKKAKARKPGRGTTFRYRLSRSAAVRIVIDKALAGRLSGKACVRPTRSNQGAKRCTRYARAGTLAQAGKAGANSLAFTGRIAGKPLPAATYRGTAIATAGKLTSKPRTLTFRIVTG